MIKLVIFDAGDILYDWKRAFEVFDRELQKFFKENELELPENYRKMWNIDEIGKAANTGKISLEEAKRKHSKLLGIDDKLFDDYKKIDQKMLDQMELKDPEAKAAVKDLKKKGYKVAILTDSPHDMKTQHEMLETIGLGGIFDGVFASCEIGHMKPDKEAYMAVLDAFDLKPSEAVFVAHDEDELVGAKQVGIKTISYKGHESGDFTIDSLKEILKILGKLNKE